MISQLSIFLENTNGRLAAATRAISEAGSNMHSLFLADTKDFGVVRVLCDNPKATAEKLTEQGWRAAVTDVLAIEVPNRPGGLADLLEFLDKENASVEYGYCVAATDDKAVDILKVSDDTIEEKLEAAGFHSVSAEELYAVA